MKEWPNITTESVCVYDYVLFDFNEVQIIHVTILVDRMLVPCEIKPCFDKQCCIYYISTIMENEGWESCLKHHRQLQYYMHGTIVTLPGISDNVFVANL